MRPAALGHEALPRPRIFPVPCDPANHAGEVERRHDTSGQKLFFSKFSFSLSAEPHNFKFLKDGPSYFLIANQQNQDGALVAIQGKSFRGNLQECFVTAPQLIVQGSGESETTDSGQTWKQAGLYGQNKK